MTGRSELGSTDSDGVLVVRAIARGADDGHLFRVTSETAGDPEPTTAAVQDPRELHRLVDQWLASLGGRTSQRN